MSEWRAVPGYEGLYEISDQGLVRSFLGRTPRILVGSEAGAGYRKVALCRDGIQSHRYVHRLVLEAFVGPCPDGMEACHGNAIRDDNRLSNLRWDTHAENNQDIIRLGNHGGVRKTHCPLRHPLVAPNLVLSELRRGHRKCRACNQARAWLQRHAGTVKEASDRFYNQIQEHAA